MEYVKFKWVITYRFCSRSVLLTHLLWLVSDWDAFVFVLHYKLNCTGDMLNLFVYLYMHLLCLGL